MKKAISAIRKLSKSFLEAEMKGLASKDPEGDTERLYIEPLFEALGWDVRSREVKTQREAGKSGKRTDYSFWTERNPRFIAEAKASSVSLDGYYIENKEKVTFTQKTLDYAWNTNVAVGVLLNFKEIRVYNATVKVDNPEKAYLFPPIHIDQIEKRFNDLWLLSRTSVESSLLEETVRKQNIEQSLPVRVPIDKAILDSLVRWRKALAIDIGERYKSHPKELSQLREVVQRILDRIIFIRVLEDLNLEAMDGLWKIATGTHKPRYKGLVKVFEYMDKYYNSMLFSKSLADSFEVGDGAIETVIKESYKYRFDRIPLDLFGSFYENYLGYIINEEQEIVKNKEQTQARGIYYTSPHIVDLICNLTLVEKLKTIKVKKKKPIPIKVLDPACGSGSFTMRAFDELVHFYGAINKTGDIYSDFENKKQVVVENIYGVDLDKQAVEVASTYHLIGLLKGVTSKPLFLPSMGGESKKKTKPKLSDADPTDMFESMPLYHPLYIKERQTVYDSLHKLVEEGAFHLPTMMGEHSTIRHGNSLVSASSSELKKFFDSGYIHEVFPFNWNTEYPEVFGGDISPKGFDVIIGNPPYRNMDEPKEGDDPDYFTKLKNYFQTYKSSRHFNWANYYRRMSDLYYFFFFRSINLLKESGLLGFITSRSYLEAHYADTLREYVLNTSCIKYIIDFQEIRVFDTASITTAITILEKSSVKKNREKNTIKVIQIKNPFIGISFQDSIRLLTEHIAKHLNKESYSDDYIEVFNVAQSSLTKEPWNFATVDEKDIYMKIDGKHPQLKDICELGQGMQTASNKIFCEFEWDEILMQGFEQAYVYKRAVNSDIKSYHYEHSGKFALYIEDVPAKNNDDLSNVPRNIRNWLLQNRSTLEDRAAYQRGDCLWFKYSFPLHKEMYHLPKIVCPYRAESNRFYLDEDAELKVYTDTTVIFPKATLLKEDEVDLYYILGILNSKLLTYRFQGIGKITSKGLFEYFWNQIGRLPIKMPDFNKSTELKLYDQVRTKAKEIQDLHIKIKDMPPTFKKRETSLQIIEKLKEQIDKAVEKLYGVSAPENS